MDYGILIHHHPTVAVPNCSNGLALENLLCATLWSTSLYKLSIPLKIWFRYYPYPTDALKKKINVFSYTGNSGAGSSVDIC